MHQLNLGKRRFAYLEAGSANFDGMVCPGENEYDFELEMVMPFEGAGLDGLRRRANANAMTHVLGRERFILDFSAVGDFIDFLFFDEI